MMSSNPRLNQLIEEVRRRPILYDSKQGDLTHNTIRSKEKAWDDISQVMGVDRLALKADWRKLRMCHKAALVRRRSKSLQLWKYEKEMRFLLKPNISHEPLGSIEFNIASPKREPDAQKDLNLHYLDEETPNEQVEPLYDVNEELAYNDDSFSFANTTETNSRDTDSFQSPHPAPATTQVPDDIELFFSSAALSVKKLPLRYRNKIKRELLDSICKAEEEIFVYNSVSQNLSV